MLNLARPIMECPVSELHGPGRRFVFWVQGCQLRCTKRCINPEALVSAPRHLTAVEDVVGAAVERCRSGDAEGITVLGGEPTEQATALAAVLRQVQHAGLSTMVYTGHTLDELRERSDPALDALLAHCDVLVDGPFIDALHDPTLRWRGSTNQRVLFLTSRYSETEILAQPIIRGLDLVMTPDGRVHVSGMHTREAAGAVSDAFRASGVAHRASVVVTRRQGESTETHVALPTNKLVK